MEDYKTIPPIEFGVDCSYDTLDSIMSGWCARIWLSEGTKRVILVAKWTGRKCPGDETHLMVWSEKDQDYSNPMTVPTDKITKIEIL